MKNSSKSNINLENNLESNLENNLEKNLENNLEDNLEDNLENNLEKNPNNNLIKNNGTKISKRNRKKTTVAIDDELDLKFRKIAASKFNFSQGWYTKAVNEAFKEWIDRNEKYFKLD